MADSIDHDETMVRAIADLPIERRVALVSGANMWESKEAPQLGLGRVRVSDGPHGLRAQPADSHASSQKPPAPATCFPTAVTLASSWDLSLVTQIGRALGEECRAQGVGVLLGPGLNIKRHPGGGRNFEYFSEDPVVSGLMAAAMVEGIQSQGVGACLKHFAANNHETYRNVANAVIDERTLRELYLRGFEIAVTRSRPWTVMCSYNQLNDTYCSEDRRLLTDILRGEWGFDGLVMSDWGATNDRALGVSAGLDLQMPGCGTAFDGEILAAIATGRCPESALNESVRRLCELDHKIRTAAVDDTSHTEATGDMYDRHHELAVSAAAAGCVLLANNGILPVEPNTRIALIGAFAETPRYQGAGSSQVTPTRLTHLREALTDLVGVEQVSYEPAYNAETGDTSPQGVARATNLASHHEVAIVVVGLPAIYESEGFDRDKLGIPEPMVKLVEAICAIQPNTVVVLMNGAPVEAPWADQPAALVEAYLGGQAGASALASVLTGAAEPGGRLAESFPVFTTDVPSNDNFPGQPRQTEYRENLFVGYRFHETAGVPARFPFGHGLSYTSFSWGAACLAIHNASGAAIPESPDGKLVVEEDETVAVSVEVFNTGTRPGSEVVQIYVEAASPTLPRPTRELAGFAKVHLLPDSSHVVEVVLDDRAFQVFDVDSNAWVTDAGVYRVVIARSSVDVVERVDIEVRSSRKVASANGGVANWRPDDESFRELLGRPIPVPAPVRPFHRNTTITDLESTWLGPILRRVVLPRIRTELTGMFPESKPDFVDRFALVAFEAPLRVVVATLEGKVRLSHIDGVIELMNHQWSAVHRRLRAGLAATARRKFAGIAQRVRRQ